MRTTVTLEPDVAAMVQRVMRDRKLTFKQAVNESLRAALRPASGDVEFRSPTFPMRLRDDVDLTKALRIASDLEDETLAVTLHEGRSSPR